MHALDKTTGASAWKQDKLAQRRPGGPQLVGDYVAVVDVEGYVHLLDRNDGSLVGRVATDGTPATAQPSRSGDSAVWQSTGGTLSRSACAEPARAAERALDRAGRRRIRRRARSVA